MSRRISIQTRILANCIVDKDSGCWLWQGACSGNGRGGGYPRMSLDGHTVAVHRVMYTNEHGMIPGKKEIEHTCRNRMCVNPDHLRMVTRLQNERLKPTCKKRVPPQKYEPYGRGREFPFSGADTYEDAVKQLAPGSVQFGSKK